MKNAKIAIFPELPKIFLEAKTIFPEAANYLPGSKTAIFPEAKTIFPETKIGGSIGGISAARFWTIGFLPVPEAKKPSIPLFTEMPSTAVDTDMPGLKKPRMPQ